MYKAVVVPSGESLSEYVNEIQSFDDDAGELVTFVYFHSTDPIHSWEGVWANWRVHELTAQPRIVGTLIYKRNWNFEDYHKPVISKVIFAWKEI